MLYRILGSTENRNVYEVIEDVLVTEDSEGLPNSWPENQVINAYSKKPLSINKTYSMSVYNSWHGQSYCRAIKSDSEGPINAV